MSKMIIILNNTNLPIILWLVSQAKLPNINPLCWIILKKHVLYFLWHLITGSRNTLFKLKKNSDDIGAADDLATWAISTS